MNSAQKSSRHKPSYAARRLAAMRANKHSAFNYSTLWEAGHTVDDRISYVASVLGIPPRAAFNARDRICAIPPNEQWPATENEVQLKRTPEEQAESMLACRLVTERSAEIRAEARAERRRFRAITEMEIKR